MRTVSARRKWLGMAALLCTSRSSCPRRRWPHRRNKTAARGASPTRSLTKLSSPYDGIQYTQIAPKLREIETTSNRVRVEVIGQSAGAEPFLATISSPEAIGRLAGIRPSATRCSRILRRRRR